MPHRRDDDPPCKTITIATLRGGRRVPGGQIIRHRISDDVSTDHALENRKGTAQARAIVGE
jgi:hypothetical protein